MTKSIAVAACIATLACSLSAHQARAQSFNIDIGPAGAAPSDTYAAAGHPGHWLSLPCTQGVNVLNLADINGTTTSVYLNQVGGTQTLQVSDPDLTRDDATLMNDFLITHTTTENCLYLYGLIPGEYEVLIYARMPATPGAMTQDHVDQEPGSPIKLVGGPWPGHHQEGISFSRHTANVASSGGNAGTLVMHAGVVSGGSLTVGAAMNAVQVRRVVAGDVTGDGHVNVNDLLGVVSAWGPCPAAGQSCFADLDHNASVDVNDLLQVISHWG